MADGAALRVEAVAGERLVERRGRLVIPPADETPDDDRLDDDAVRALRDADQR